MKSKFIEKAKKKAFELAFLTAVAGATFSATSVIAHAANASDLITGANKSRTLYLGNGATYDIQSVGNIEYNDNVAFYTSDIEALVSATNDLMIKLGL